MVNTDSLKKGALILGTLLVIFIGFYAAVMIGGLITGSVTDAGVGSWNGTAYTDAADTGVAMSAAMANAVQGYEASYITDVTSLQGNATLIIGLIAIVVIMLVFGFKFNFGREKGGVK